MSSSTVSPWSPSGSSEMFPSTWPCLDLSHGSSLEPFLQSKKIDKRCSSAEKSLCWFCGLYLLCYFFVSNSTVSWSTVRGTELLAVKDAFGALWESSGKADYVNQNGEWFILMWLTSLDNEAHLNNIHVKILKKLFSLSRGQHQRSPVKWIGDDRHDSTQAFN